MEPIRIDLPIRPNESRKNVVVKQCFLTLHNRHMEYSVVCSFDILSEATGVWKLDKQNYRWTRARRDLVDVAMWRDEIEDQTCYAVQIEFNGVDCPVCWHYDDPKEALAVYSKLKAYFVNFLQA